MPQLPILSGKEIINAFSKINYSETRRRSSHIRLSCHGKKSITVPDYRIVSRDLLRKILRDAELSVDAFLQLLD